MPKFRKKPVTVEAMQFDPNVTPWPEDVVEHPVMSNAWWIDTLEGGHIVTPGDWIITGVRGERYPCKPGIFEATYEEITDDD